MRAGGELSHGYRADRSLFGEIGRDNNVQVDDDRSVEQAGTGISHAE